MSRNKNNVKKSIRKIKVYLTCKTKTGNIEKRLDGHKGTINETCFNNFGNYLLYL